jgi:hypothetical protein
MAILRFLPFLLLCIQLHAQDIYKTPSGTKYHLASCRMVKNVSEKITVQEAQEQGLQPCKICNPHNIYADRPGPVNKAKGEGASVQCKGITKSGTRCKHMTKIANGYCFQHQPG